MKIISRYKDYYDYLQGIYGVDDKVILDRTSSKGYPGRPGVGNKVVIHICDIEIQGMLKDGKYLYGEELRPLALPSSSRRPLTFFNFKEGSRIFTIYSLPQPSRLNSITGIPILMMDQAFGEIKHNGINYCAYPKLETLELYKIFTPERTWRLLYDWISRRNEPSAPPPMTDQEKIESHGFDKQNSFRK